MELCNIKKGFTFAAAFAKTMKLCFALAVILYTYTNKILLLLMIAE